VNTLEEFLLKIPNYQNYRVKQFFPSKKNIVALVSNKGNQYILKWYQFNTTTAIKQEIFILQKTRNVIATPNIVSYNLDNNILLMNYLPGMNLCDAINDKAVSFHTKKKYIKLLAEWFSTFHHLLYQKNNYIIHGDAILRNFIISNNTLIGVDFEETRPGNPIEDISLLCASILTTNPQNTKEKKELSDVFIHTYETKMRVEYSNIQSYINSAIKQINLRRYMKKK